MPFVLLVFGAIGGFVGGQILGHSTAIGVGGAVIGGLIGRGIGSTFSKSAVQHEAAALSGPTRSTGAAIFWWFVLLLIAGVALVMVGLKLKH